jgi:hypothetical protein
MFRIYDGREHFYQWDLDRKLIVEDDSISQVHFCNKTGESSFVLEVYELEGARVVDVPNILLQTDWRICVYAYDVNYTKHMARFDVVARSKPQSYVYTETEVLNFNTLLEKIENIEGSIEQVVVDYLEENPIEVEVDLDAYYTKEQTDKAIADAVGAIVIPDVPEADFSNYYTKDEVDEAIEGAKPNLDTYALKTEIPTVPSLEPYALKTEIPDVSVFITEDDVNTLINAALGVIENGTY